MVGYLLTRYIHTYISLSSVGFVCRHALYECECICFHPQTIRNQCGRRSRRLLDFSPRHMHNNPSVNGEIIQSKQEYEEARRSKARHIPKKTMGNSSLVCC
ncbi:uncharacterized protein LOC119307334 [Triticum dicoccoides]|uniref:uncharacterized protein LOC119307334 n=1 Tax=Triticum dicoccoides TaxID=85692 RepID=UPI00188EDDB6|nr:uncharacterized protein LOC119307334 [Triticum dicoccoides]